jgi:hypothetical protein
MAKVTVGLNADIFRKSMMTTIPQLKALGAANLQRKFDAGVNDSVKVLESHSVTQELIQSSHNPQKSNSRLIEGSSIYANLFNVLGFNAGQNPADDLRSFLLQEAFEFNKNQVTAAPLGNSKVILDYFISFSDLKDTDNYEKFLLEWNGKSWLRLIEEGINNVEFFLQKDKYGRSTGGIQLPHKVNEMAKFIPEKYYSLMIEAFLRRFKL